MVCRNNEEECSVDADISNGDDQGPADSLPVAKVIALNLKLFSSVTERIWSLHFLAVSYI